jgi:hypothetical protein
MRVGVVVAIVLAPAIAIAEPAARTARLDVSGECPLAGLAQQTADLLGRAGIADDAVAFISVASERVDRELQATLTLYDEQRQPQPLRAVTAATCDELEASLAIVVALALQQEPAPAPALPSLPAVPPPPAAEAEPTVDVAPPVAPATSEARTSVHWGLSYATSRDAMLAIGAARGHLGGEVRIFEPRTEDLELGSVRVHRAELAVTGCLEHGAASACGVAFAGVVRGRGQDLMEPDSSILPVVGGGARLQWQARLREGVAVRVFAEAVQLAVSTRFLVDDAVVWTMPSRSASLGAGMIFQLP